VFLCIFFFQNQIKQINCKIKPALVISTNYCDFLRHYTKVSTVQFVHYQQSFVVFQNRIDIYKYFLYSCIEDKNILKRKRESDVQLNLINDLLKAKEKIC